MTVSSPSPHINSTHLRPQFWQKFSLNELTNEEWEALCDGCGACCLVKFLEEDEEPEDVIYTDVACKLLDCQTGWCSSYPNRHDYVPDCISLNYDALQNMMWLPDSCSYKRLYCGLDLPEWHFLLTGDKHQTARGMKSAGVGVAGRCVSETGMHDDEIEERTIHWVTV